MSKGLFIHSVDPQITVTFNLVAHVLGKTQGQLLQEVLASYLESHPDLFSQKIKIEVQRAAVMQEEINSPEADKWIALAEKNLAKPNISQYVFGEITTELQKHYHMPKVVSTGQKTKIAQLLNALSEKQLKGHVKAGGVYGR